MNILVIPTWQADLTGRGCQAGLSQVGPRPDFRQPCVEVRSGRIGLKLTVLNLQMKKPNCKCRTVIVVLSTKDPTKSHFNILYLVSLLFAPPILHTTNHFLDREVFDLLVPLIFFSLPGVFNIWLSVFVAMYSYRTLRFQALILLLIRIG